MIEGNLRGTLQQEKGTRLVHSHDKTMQEDRRLDADCVQ